MERLTGLLSIKEDLSIIKEITESNGEAINFNTDNQFKSNNEVLTPRPCTITLRSKESERYLRNQAEIHWLLFWEWEKPKVVAWKFNIWRSRLTAMIKYYTDIVPGQMKWREEKALSKFND